MKASSDHLVFDVNNVDYSFANALRRIMLAEVPTMAIEYVNIEVNDTPMHDEVLAHRLGLIPIRADANDYEPCASRADLQTGKNCIELVLDVTARKSAVKSDGCVHVLTKEFRAVSGEGAEVSASDKKKKKKKGKDESSDEDDEDADNFMIHQDILVTKLKPGQRIKIRCFAIRGIGQSHIKWSPVSTASYRATPKVMLKDMITGSDAEEIKRVCPKNVFDIEDGELVVANMKACSMCRECIRTPKKRDSIALGRIEDSFCFSVETVGALAPEEIVRRSIKVLKDKCITVRDHME